MKNYDCNKLSLIVNDHVYSEMLRVWCGKEN